MPPHPVSAAQKPHAQSESMRQFPGRQLLVLPALAPSRHAQTSLFWQSLSEKHVS